MRRWLGYGSEVIMNEEKAISEEEKDVKLLEIIQALSELGENKIANELFKQLEKKITFAEREDWINEQICSMFPSDIDIRCITFCCSPSNNCPYRTAVLKKLGWTMKDYVNLKAEFGERIKKMLEE
jgi:DNA modification methylase